MKKIAFFLLLCLIVRPIVAQNVVLDSVYGTVGGVLTSLRHTATNTIVGYNMRLANNGSMFVAGEKNDRFAVEKIDPDGQGKTSFAHPFYALRGFRVGMALQQDGKVIVATTDTFAPFATRVIRFEPTGEPDFSFGQGGVSVPLPRMIYFSSLFEQRDGKIVVFGVMNDAEPVSVVSRLNADGSLDSTFANNGQMVKDLANSYEFLNAGVQQSDDKLVFAGYANGRAALMRLLPNGSLDSTYGENGVHKEPGSFGGWVDAVTLIGDDKMITAGDAQGKGFVMRYKYNGTRDSSFGVNGVHWVPETYEGVSVVTKPDGKILVALKTRVDDHTELTLLQLLPDGQRDTTFGLAGLFRSDLVMAARTLEIQGNKAYVGSQLENFSLVVHRFLLDLNVGLWGPDTPPDNQVMIYPNPVSGPFSLKFELAAPAAIQVKLYDIAGREVQSMYTASRQEAGENTIPLQCSDGMPSGTYILSLEINGKQKTSVQLMRQ